MPMPTSMPVRGRSSIRTAFSLIDASILASVATTNNLVETLGAVRARASDGAAGFTVLFQTTTCALPGKSDERILEVASADARHPEKPTVMWSDGCDEEEGP